MFSESSERVSEHAGSNASEFGFGFEKFISKINKNFWNTYYEANNEQQNILISSKPYLLKRN